MRNLYQSPNPSPSTLHHHHHHSYPNTSHNEQAQFIENTNLHQSTSSLINQSSPKIIQVHHRNSQSPSTCFINKQAFLQPNHQSPKIKSIFQANNFLSQSPTEQSVKSPILLNQNKQVKSHKLSSSSSISSTSSISFLNSTLSNTQPEIYVSENENNIRPSSILKNKFSSPTPLVVSSSSSSSTSSSPSPVLKNIQEQQNDRFFDSNTLYKKELKQKQRDILSTSITSLSKNNSYSHGEQQSPQKVTNPHAQLQLQKLQQSLMKHEMEKQISHITQSPSSHLNTSEFISESSGLSRNEKRSTLPHNLNTFIPNNTSPTSNNKVLNLFTNLLNRSKTEQTPNYLNIKNLKRATSSSQFSKSKLNDSTSSTSPKSNDSKSDSKSDSKASLSSLFNSKSKLNKNEGTKMRRSLDDVARLSILNSENNQNVVNENDTFISLDNKKFENTAFSTKNNGLIFIPQQQFYDNYENLDNLENIDTGSNDRSLYSTNFKVCDSKPSDEILKRINSLTKKTNDDSNAFDNVVYSYVDNIRQHSKRLSEINLLHSSAIAAATAAAAAAVSSLNEQNSQSVNSNLNTLSCSSGSSSISSNSFHSSISPKSHSSSETVINPAAYSNVMSLRDKFESYKQEGCESPKASVKSISLKSDGLSVNTSISVGNKNNLNSPALSSISSSSSRSSAISSSLSSGSFSKDLQIQNNEIIEVDEHKFDQEEKKVSSSNKNRFQFNFYYEFYRYYLNSDETEDEECKLELDRMKLMNDKLFVTYENVLGGFITRFYQSNVFLRNVLDPILADSLSTYTSNSSLFNFKFTIEFFKPILLASKKQIQPIAMKNLNLESYEMINMNQNDLFKENNFNKQINMNLYEFNSNNYGQLFNEINSKLNGHRHENIDTNEFDLLKSKLILFILYKLQYFNDELKIVQRNVELNDKIGVKIQKELEINSNMSSIELDKYKLLVNESDVITNLLLKLCNKIAHTENTIQLLQLMHFNSNFSSETESNEVFESKLSSEEIDILKQELNQIHRKKDEALYLKNGIDKRSKIVSEFLSKYRNREQIEEFDLFLNSKLLNALKQRHLKDHIELAQLQLKILNDLKLV